MCLLNGTLHGINHYLLVKLQATVLYISHQHCSAVREKLMAEKKVLKSIYNIRLSPEFINDRKGKKNKP